MILAKRGDRSKTTSASVRGGAPAVTPLGGSADADGELPFTVELWTLTRESVECVLGRAASAALAQAIFVAAQTEHLGRRITLRRGFTVVSESPPPG